MPHHHLQRGRIDHRPVDAHADVALARGHHAAEARPEPAGHAGLQRELGGHPAFRAQRADRLEHGRRPAGVDRRRRDRREQLAQRLGDQPGPPDRAVLGDHRGGAAEQLRAAGVRGAERKPRITWRASGRPAPACRPAAARRRCRRQPAAAASARRRAGTQRPEDRAASAARRGQLPSRRVPGPTSSSRKSSSTPPPAGAGAGGREGARQEGPLALPPPHPSPAASM